MATVPGRVRTHEQKLKLFFSLGELPPPPGQQGGLGGGTPPNFKTDNLNFFSPEGMSDLF